MKIKSIKSLIDTSYLCKYCNKQAFFLINENIYCCKEWISKCEVLRLKNSKWVASKHKDWTLNSDQLKKYQFWNWYWSTAQIEENRLKTIDSLKKWYKLWKIKPAFLWKKHSEETKQKISAKMIETTNWIVKTKYFEIFCPYLNENILVQWTWEYKYAKYLNDQEINWVKSRKIFLNYTLSDGWYLHKYYPDFYLPDTDKYIEIKWFLWKSKDGRVDDERKLLKIKEFNKTISFDILYKNELKQLWIDI